MEKAATDGDGGCVISGSVSAAKAVNPQNNSGTQAISAVMADRAGLKRGVCRFIAWDSSFCSFFLLI
jgi:hypothetical protein